MMKDFSSLISILKKEVRPALGCTEPAAVAFAVAKVSAILGGKIDKIVVSVSKNIFKNAKAVIIPNTNESGLNLAAALGMLLRNPEKELELFENVKPADIIEAHSIIQQGKITIKLSDCDGIYIEAQAKGEKGWAEVYVSGGHTNIIKEIINGEIVFVDEKDDSCIKEEKVAINEFTIRELVNFIEEVQLEEILFLQDGIVMNENIALKGLEMKPGLALGAGINNMMIKGIIKNDIVNKVRIMVAAACDARMAGLNIPVMSSMGSGNHGIEAIVPLAVMGREVNADKNRLIRAVALSHLITAIVKHHTGKLTPICGCSVAAGVGVTAGITWLLGGSISQIEGAIKNIIGNLTGMVCDGAKGGCALKLSTAAGEAVTSAYLALQGVIISNQDGIISETIEDTIRNLGEVSYPGMANADSVILKIMLNKENNN